MKKLLSIILATTLMASLTACAGGSSSSSASAGTPSLQDGGSSSLSTTEANDKLAQIKSAGKIVFVTSPDYAPYEFVDLSKMGKGDEQYVGADVELARYIAKELGVKLEIQAMDFDSVLASVTEGKCDIAISGIAAREDRKSKMDFSISYNDDGTQGIMIKKADADKFKAVEDLNKAEAKVGSQNASIQQEAAKEHFPNATQITVAKLGDGVIELSKGKIDALIISSEAGAGYAASYPELAMSSIPWDIPNDGTAVGVPKGNDAFVAELDKIIEKVKTEGLYKQWLQEAQDIAALQAK